MKILVIIVASLLFLNANSSQMTLSEHSFIHKSNNRRVEVIAKKNNMHKIHLIDEEKAKNIVSRETKEEVLKLKLRHLGRELFYIVDTSSYSIKLNALSGEIIEKKKHD